MKFERTIYALVIADSKKQYIKCFADEEFAKMKEALIREHNPELNVRLFTVPFEEDDTIYDDPPNWFRRNYV